MSREKAKGVGNALVAIVALVVVPQLFLKYMPSFMAHLIEKFIVEISIFGIVIAVLYIIKHFSDIKSPLRLLSSIALNLLWLYVFLFITGSGNPANFGVINLKADAVELSIYFRIFIQILIFIILLQILKDLLEFMNARKDVGKATDETGS